MWCHRRQLPAPNVGAWLASFKMVVPKEAIISYIHYHNNEGNIKTIIIISLMCVRVLSAHLYYSFTLLYDVIIISYTTTVAWWYILYLMWKVSIHPTNGQLPDWSFASWSKGCSCFRQVGHSILLPLICCIAWGEGSVFLFFRGAGKRHSYKCFALDSCVLQEEELCCFLFCAWHLFEILVVRTVLLVVRCLCPHIYHYFMC